MSAPLTVGRAPSSSLLFKVMRFWCWKGAPWPPIALGDGQVVGTRVFTQKYMSERVWQLECVLVRRWEGGSPGIEARTRCLWSLFLFFFKTFTFIIIERETPECGSRWELKAYFVLLSIVFNTFPYEGPVRVHRNQSAVPAGRLNQTLRRARNLRCCSTGSWAQRARRGVGGGGHESDVVSALDAAPEGRALRYVATGSRRGALYKKKIK